MDAIPGAKHKCLSGEVQLHSRNSLVACGEGIRDIACIHGERESTSNCGQGGNLGTAAESRHAEFELVDRSLDERLPASASSHVEHLLQLHVHRLEN